MTTSKSRTTFYTQLAATPWEAYHITKIYRDYLKSSQLLRNINNSADLKSQFSFTNKDTITVFTFQRRDFELQATRDLYKKIHANASAPDKREVVRISVFAFRDNMLSQ